MGIRFYRLMDMLNRKNMTREQLRKAVNMSSSTMAKLSASGNVSMDVVDKICNYMNCQPGDIMEWVPKENHKTAVKEERE